MTDSMTIHYEPEHDNSPAVWPDPHQDSFSKSFLGFWLYLVTDCLIFATLFTTYAIMHIETFGGVGPKDIISLKLTFIETITLLFSSVTCGLSVISAVKSNVKWTLIWLAATFMLGSIFLLTEFHEFRELYLEGHDWTKSAFLSSFFTLVGTHGLHVTMGSIWLLVNFFQVYFKGITMPVFRRLVIFSLFWHFLDLIWIFIFTLVYLFGVI